MSLKLIHHVIGNPEAFASLKPAADPEPAWKRLLGRRPRRSEVIQPGFWGSSSSDQAAEPLPHRLPRLAHAGPC